MALSDVTSADTGDGLLYVPPRSAAFRTSIYPGFFTGGSPTNLPNPVAGDSEVAAPSTGEFGYTPPAEPAQPAGLASITSNPIDLGDKGEGADQRQANALNDARLTGYDENPNDALKAANIASSIAGGLTGIAGLGIGEAATALGVNPTDSIYGGGSTFDFTGNINQRPGYDDAFRKAQAEVLRTAPRYTSPNQLAQRTLNAVNNTLTSGSATWGLQGATQPRDAVASPATPSITQLNSTTGFGAQSSADRTGGAAPNPGAGTGSGVTDLGAAAAAPSASASNGKGGGGSSGNGGGSNGGGGYGSSERAGGFHDQASRGPGAGHGGYRKGGVVTKHHMKPHHKAAAAKNHAVMKALAAKTGKTPGQIAVKHMGDKGTLGAMARLQMHVAQMACGGKVRKMADGGVMADGAGEDPSQSLQYNPPPEMTAGEGDTEHAMLTPGEMVITKPAAQQYDPEVLAALNDPEKAAMINEAIEQLLSGEDDGDGMDPESASEDATDESDDASGLGVMADAGGRPGMFRQPGRLAGITRAA